MDKWDPNWKNSGLSYYDNYWAGAKKACDDIGMSLPDKSKLESLYQASQKDSSLGLPTSGWFWSSSEKYAKEAYNMLFDNGYTEFIYKHYSGYRVLCVGD